MKATVRNISKQTGFSPATVSNALNRKKGVNAQTADAILKTAQEMGYFQDVPIEKKIKFVMVKKTGRITDDTPFFTMMIDGFQGECSRQGYEMVLCYLNRNDEDFEEQARNLVSDPNSMIALMGAEMTDEDLNFFRDAKCPLITLDYWNDDMTFSGITIDNDDATRKAIGYLIEKGHRRIGYLKGSFRIKAFQERGESYRMTLDRKGIPYEEKYTVTLDTTMDGAYHDMVDYLKDNPELPSAYFADNDMIALGALKAMKEAGIRIPEDVSIMGFDDLPFSEIASPRLSSMQVAKQEMGILGVRKLLEIMTYGDYTKTRLQICPTFVERDSVKDVSQ